MTSRVFCTNKRKDDARCLPKGRTRREHNLHQLVRYCRRRPPFGRGRDVISYDQRGKREETYMIDRRMLTTLLAGAAAASGLSPRLSWGQAGKSQIVFYASVGSELALYGMNVEDATLVKRNAVILPGNVQY